MSIILHKPKGVKLPQAAIQKSFEQNSDGAGFCYSLDNKLVTRKGFKSYENLYAELLKVEGFSLLIHFADKDTFVEKKYLQPFILDKTHTIFHVGTVWKKEALEFKEESQGYNFSQLVKRFWTPIFFGKNYLNWLITESLSHDNRAAIMNNLGDIQFFNKSKGIVLSDCWFSDSPYRFSHQTGFPNQNNQNRYDYLPDRNNLTNATGFHECCKCRISFTRNSIIHVGTLKYCIHCHKDIFASKFPARTSNIVPFRTEPRPETTQVNSFIKEFAGVNPDLIDLMELL